MEKAEITGAQVRTAITPRDAGPKDTLRLRRVAPIALRDAWTGKPDFADLAVRTDRPALGIHNVQRVSGGNLATTDHARTKTGKAGLAGGLLQRVPVEPTHHRPRAWGRARDEESGFGEAVAREKGLTPEAIFGEHRGETVERLVPHRLRAVEGEPPAAQIEIPPVVRSDLAQAELVAEIRAAAGSRPVCRDRPQPAYRLFKKGKRWHQNSGGTDVERLENVSDQSHVVVERQPADHCRFRIMGERPADCRLIGHQRTMTNHDAFRPAGRSRGVLEKSQSCGGNRQCHPALRRIPWDGIRSQPGQIVPPPADPGETGKLRFQRCRCHHHGRARVLNNGAQPMQMMTRGRIGWHRHDPGIKTAKEGFDVVEPRRIKKQRTLPRRRHTLQDPTDRAGAEVERREIDALGFGFAIGEENKGGALRSACRAVSQHGHDIG